jgi:GH15 family glucan-1,4-alpha-glucosidase
MATYREPHTKLPAPSYDLWEERRGIHAFTTAAVWAGLTAACNFAVAFGQHELAKRYAVAAAEIRDAALQHLWDADRGRFVRTINVLPDGTIVKDATLDVSLAGIFLFGLLPASDPRVVSTMRAIEERLSVRTPVGGIARYENDYYFQVSSDIANVPGNPWFVATLWLADHRIATAQTRDDLVAPRALLDWCATRALPSGILSEQVHPHTGEPLSVSPLTWSHAAFVSTVQHYARRASAIEREAPAPTVAAREVIA